MTTMSTIIRKASRCALRSLSHRHTQTSSYSSLVSSHVLLRKLPQNPPKTNFVLSCRFASSVKKAGVDEHHLRVLESEIKCAEESDDLKQGKDLPHGFPFEIIDTPGEQPIMFKREFNGEIITVGVQLAVLGEEEKGKDDEDDDNKNQSSVQPRVAMVVNVIKGKGPSLVFFCIAYPDDITIDRMFLEKTLATADGRAYRGPVFADLDENLQKDAYNYLELRGINSSATNFMLKYMTGKDDRECLSWLKRTKEFVERLGLMAAKLLF